MPCIKFCHFSQASAAFDLGLERTGGFRTVAFCEIDPFCRRVLAKHWPDVPCYEDVRTLTAERLASDGITVDCIVGGFPCQDLSIAGRGAGLDGERSGLWSEYRRLIGDLRPRYVIVENVAVLLARGLGTILGDLASIGFDAEWHCIPASAAGAPHERDRLWIVAYPNGGQRLQSVGAVRAGRDAARSRGEAMADAIGGEFARGGKPERMGRLPIAREVANDGYARRAGWSAEPCLGRMAHGVPNRVHRLRCLGNAVVPQIPEMIGRAILEADQLRNAA